MASGIFVRIETYALHRSRKARSRRATVSDLVAEIEREPGHRAHVDDFAPEGHRRVDGPRPGMLVAGCRPRDVKRRLSREVPSARDERGRVPRRDQRVLAGFVVSAPVPPAAYERDPAVAEVTDRLFEDSLAFLERYLREVGGEIASAVAHVDESYMRLHVLALPSRVPGFQANALHPGKAAERAARAAGLARPTARAAAKSALGAFLDRYHAEVGARFALARRRAAEARPRMTRQALAQARQAPGETPGPTVSDETRAQMPDVADPPGKRGWRLDDFVPGAEVRLARLSARPDPWGAAPSADAEPDGAPDTPTRAAPDDDPAGP